MTPSSKCDTDQVLGRSAAAATEKPCVGDRHRGPQVQVVQACLAAFDVTEAQQGRAILRVARESAAVSDDGRLSMWRSLEWFLQRRLEAARRGNDDDGASSTTGS